MFIASVVAWGVTGIAVPFALGDLLFQWLEQKLARQLGYERRQRL